jgi:hypothetical protein
MTTCANKGYLVNGQATIPVDPTEVHVDDLPAVACSRIRCSSCKALVRNAPRLAFRTKDDISGAELTKVYDTPDLATSPLLHTGNAEWRLYLCKCSRWLETEKHACAEPNPDSDIDPTMPWGCDGHPTISLPHDLDGDTIDTRDELRALVLRGFKGYNPPFVRPADTTGAWLWRLPARLQPADAAVVHEAALECLADPDPLARARALELFTISATEAQRLVVAGLLETQRSLYAGVPNTTTLFTVDKTLEDTAWRVLAPLFGRSGERADKIRDRGRDQALAGSGTRGLYDALSKGDSTWMIANAEAIARAAPTTAGELMFSFSQLPSSAPIKALRDRVRKVISP